MNPPYGLTMTFSDDFGACVLHWDAEQQCYCGSYAY